MKFVCAVDCRACACCNAPKSRGAVFGSETGFFFFFTGGETVFVGRRFTIIGLRFIGLAFEVGRLAVFFNGLTVFVVRLAATVATFRAGVPTEVRFVAFTRDVVLLRAALDTLVFLLADFLPLELERALERPALDFDELPFELDLDPPLDLPRELERPLLVRELRVLLRAIIFYAPLKFSKVKCPLMRSPRT